MAEEQQNEQLEQPQKSIEEIVAEDGRYHMNAFNFLHKALVQSCVQHHPDPEDPQKHVTGQQLSQSIASLAREQWGLMAPTVLKSWNVYKSIDFGNMVYLLIDHDFMNKTDGDSLEDFRDVFDVETDFDISDQIKLAD